MTPRNENPHVAPFDGPNSTRVETGFATLWFSYQTLVAFWVRGYEPVVHTNAWSTTTGRHLNAIDGGGPEARAARVDAQTFAQLWTEQTARFNAPLTKKG
jgi:hypothetical protein